MLIFSYLRINDLRIEASCVFEKPIIYREKINCLLRNFLIQENCLVIADLCLITTMIHVFVFPMIWLKDNTCKEAFYNVEDIMKEFYYKILSFRVWNHLFLCEWSQHIKDMGDLHKAAFV